jgi:hypothetical protein
MSFLLSFYVCSSTKSEKRAELLTGSEAGERGRGWGQRGEMAQIMYAHRNK